MEIFTFVCRQNWHYLKDFWCEGTSSRIFSFSTVFRHLKSDIIVNRTFSSEIQHENLVRILSMNTLSRPNRFWYLCRKRPKLLAACKSVVKTISLLFTRYNRSVCSACGADVEFYVNHRVLWCPIYQGVRQKFWNLLWQNFGEDIYLRLSSMNDDAILNVMFGAFDMVADILNTDSEENFYSLIVCYIQRLNIL